MTLARAGPQAACHGRRRHDLVYQVDL